MKLAAQWRGPGGSSVGIATVVLAKGSKNSGEDITDVGFWLESREHSPQSVSYKREKVRKTINITSTSASRKLFIHLTVTREWTMRKMTQRERWQGVLEWCLGASLLHIWTQGRSLKNWTKVGEQSRGLLPLPTPTPFRKAWKRLKGPKESLPFQQNLGL